MDNGSRLALFSIALNLGLVFLQYGLAAYSGSLALRADAGSDMHQTDLRAVADIKAQLLSPEPPEPHL